MGNIMHPTEKGVWWRDNDKWERYPPESARKVLRAFRNGDAEVVLGPFTSPQHPLGVSYTVNLDSMKQTNAKTGFSRDVKIISGHIDEEKGSYEDDQAFSRAYSQQSSTQSGKSILENQSSTAQAGNGTVSMAPSVAFDLQRLRTQCHLEDQCNLAFKLPEHGIQSNIQLNSLRKKTMEMLLEKLTRQDFIEGVVRKKDQSAEPDWTWKVSQCKPYIVGQADHSESYGPFFSSLCNVAEEDDGFVDNLFGVAEKGNTAEGDPVQYLFKSASVAESPSTVVKSVVAPTGFVRCPPMPCEGSILFVFLAIAKFLQAGTQSVEVTKKGSAIPLAQLAAEDQSDYISSP
eukprot:Gb_21393 [translate_table: standard]